jgi:uncharacterized protein (TIGR00266 family)
VKVNILGGKSFSYLKIALAPNEKIISESGAMASMAGGIELKAKLNGSIFRALIIKFLGSESFFLSHFSNPTSSEQEITLTQTQPGEIVCHNLKPDEDLLIQSGAFIACVPSVSFSVRYAGISSWLAGEGLFRLRFRGEGDIWYGAYGAVIEKNVVGEYIVDSGHLLSYPPGMKLRIKLSGGIFSSIFSGEGLVLKLIGNGNIKLQSRSIGGLAGWLNSRFSG